MRMDPVIQQMFLDHTQQHEMILQQQMIQQAQQQALMQGNLPGNMSGDYLKRKSGQPSSSEEAPPPEEPIEESPDMALN